MKDPKAEAKALFLVLSAYAYIFAAIIFSSITYLYYDHSTVAGWGVFGGFTLMASVILLIGALKK